ncbi:uncharacterized protein [Ptychodera flava]|uniref:uncharacterized protein n=1 Tax=Ptychodera flava TaxID=63121 RepID=UPI003969C350
MKKSMKCIYVIRMLSRRRLILAITIGLIIFFFYVLRFESKSRTGVARKQKARPKEINLEELKNLTIKRHEVIGASNKQGEDFGFLMPKERFVVPNIAHFIWFTCHTFRFENLISLLSVHRIMRADKIYFHTDCEPDGKLWQEARQLIPTLIVAHRTRPSVIFDKKLNPMWPEHSADIARLEILMETGGVFLDTDVIVVAPLEPLRYYDYVAGRSSDGYLSNGIILATKDSEFLRRFYKSYVEYENDCWDCNSVTKHHDLAVQNSALIHVEPTSLNTPSPDQWEQALLGKFDWKHDHFTIHVWFRKFRDGGKRKFTFTPQNIKLLDTSFGEMCRYIYFGNPDLVKPGF